MSSHQGQCRVAPGSQRHEVAARAPKLDAIALRCAHDGVPRIEPSLVGPIAVHKRASAGLLVVGRVLSSDVGRGSPVSFTDYSVRSATIGSTRVARHAGRAHANNVTTRTTAALVVSVAASVGAIPYSKLERVRASPNAAIKPARTPTIATVIPCRVIR